MSIRRIALSVAAIVALPVAAQQQTYVFDPVHSQPGFEARHLGMSTQTGAFAKSSTKVVIDRAAQKGSIDATIDATSLRTFDATRLDAVVKGEKYFNVEKFPTITYKSDSVKFDGERVVRVEGELTMLGVTTPVALDVQNFTCGANPFNKKPMCGGQATATIKRSDFGMSAGLPYAPADEVRIIIPFEAYQTDS